MHAARHHPPIREEFPRPAVCLIDAEGTHVGVVSIEVALDRARRQNLQLVEVGPMAYPPIVQLVDPSPPA